MGHVKIVLTRILKHVDSDAWDFLIDSSLCTSDKRVHYGESIVDMKYTASLVVARTSGGKLESQKWQWRRKW